jgi:hypothetical protein
VCGWWSPDGGRLPESARGQSERTPAVSIVGRLPPTVCHGRAHSASASLPEALLEAGDAHATGEIMYEFVGRERFCEIFKGRAVMVPELPAGRSRVLAHTANKTAGRDDASLRTKSEYLALFDLLMAHVPPAASTELRLLDEAGRPTAAARVIEDYIAASRGKPEFFDADMYMFHVTGFQPGHGVLTEPVKPGHGARLDVWRTDPAHHRHIPDPHQQGTLFSTRAFLLKNSGNRTLRAPKRSWRIILEGAGSDNRLAGMTRINLKAMYNDPSQMREALAWRLFGLADVAAHVCEAGLRRNLPRPVFGH